MNLLTNARDALNQRYPGHDENKKVIIRAFVISDCRLPIGGEEDRRWGPQSQIAHCTSAIRLTVEDHGAGIPEDVCTRIFDPCFTTKPHNKGTGLGLTISHGIVKDHGGELSVESAVGQWTRFHVDLPVGDEPRDDRSP
jgi:signal transduction histidine kinase